MNKKAIRFIMVGLLIASITFIGACSSEETSQPAKEITMPKHEEAKEIPTAPALEKKSKIEETPIVESAPVMATEEKTAAIVEPAATEPQQTFGTVQDAGMENVPPAPEAESEVTVTEDAGEPEGAQIPRGGTSQP